MSSSLNNKNEYIFTWWLDSSVYFDGSDTSCNIRSPVFTANNLAETSWHLAIKLSKIKNEELSLTCTLVRDHAGDGDEAIKIDWWIEIANDKNPVSVDNSEVLSNVFKKGYSSLGGTFNIQDMQEHLILQCHLSQYLSAKQSVYAESTVRSVLGNVKWSPDGLSDTTIFSGTEGAQFEVYFIKNEADKDIKLCIRRLDHICLLPYYLVCKVILYVKEKKIYTGDMGRNKKPLIKCDSLTLNTGLEKGAFETSDLSVSVKYMSSALLRTTSNILKEYHENVLKIDSLNKDNDILQKDMFRMYNDGIRSDVKLKIGDKMLSSHKCILSARSAVFSAMFDQDMTESQTGIVEISDVNVETMDLLLKFMYTGTCQYMNDKNAISLLFAAEKYEILHLKEKCAAYLETVLTDVNVCQILDVADLVGHISLKNAAMEYVISHANVILLSDNWKKLVRENIDVAAEVLSKMSVQFGKKMNET